MHHVIATNCLSKFRLCPTFLLSVPLLVVIWSYQEQRYYSATGILCGWSGRHWNLFGTYIMNFKNILKTHLFSCSYFTNCFAEYEQRTLYGALVVTL